MNMLHHEATWQCFVTLAHARLHIYLENYVNDRNSDGDQSVDGDGDGDQTRINNFWNEGTRAEENTHEVLQWSAVESRWTVMVLRWSNSGVAVE